MTALLERPTTPTPTSTRLAPRPTTEVFEMRAFVSESDGHTVPDSFRLLVTPVDGPARDSFVLRSINEIALALHVSGVELTETMPVEQIAAAVVTGVHSIGLAALVELNEQDRAYGVLDNPTAAQTRANHALWAHKRSMLCIGRADWLIHSLRDDVYTTPTPDSPGPVVTARVTRGC